MSKDDYIKLISSKSDRYGDKLLELMKKYNKLSLKEITLEEAKEFWEALVNYDEEPNTRVCDGCMKDIDIDNESHFESTFDNYLCFECGDAVLSLKFEYEDYNL